MEAERTKLIRIEDSMGADVHIEAKTIRGALRKARELLQIRVPLRCKSVGYNFVEYGCNSTGYSVVLSVSD